MADAHALPTGLTVLVVEDEALVALNLETMLEDLGCNIVGPIMRLDCLEALIAGPVEADAAILDVNIGGREIYHHAERLAALGIPLVFATGYGREGLPEAWHRWPIIQKPYSSDEIARALARNLAPGAAAG